MDSKQSLQGLPDYKLEFLKQLDDIRKAKLLSESNNDNKILNSSQSVFQKSAKQAIGGLTQTTNCNDIWNTGQYGNNEWRQNLTTTFYNTQHNEDPFKLNELLNPEVGQKENYMRATRISEYSNAMHNNRVNTHEFKVFI